MSYPDTYHPNITIDGIPTKGNVLDVTLRKKGYDVFLLTTGYIMRVCQESHSHASLLQDSKIIKQEKFEIVNFDVHTKSTPKVIP